MTNKFYQFGARFVSSGCLRLTAKDNVLSIQKKLFVCSNHEFQISTAKLLQGLFDFYRERVVLIDEQDAIDIRTLVPLSRHAYRVSAPSVTNDLRDLLTLGGWMMMFANEELQNFKIDGSDWFSPDTLQEALTKNSLGCVISSWFDDNEWLVALSQDTRNSPVQG